MGLFRKNRETDNAATTTPGPFTHNGDGTGGSAPNVQSYVAVNGEDPANSAIGIGPHAADGILLKNGAFVAAGIAVPNLQSD